MDKIEVIRGLREIPELCKDSMPDAERIIRRTIRAVRVYRDPKDTPTVAEQKLDLLQLAA